MRINYQNHCLVKFVNATLFSLLAATAFAEPQVESQVEPINRDNSHGDLTLFETVEASGNRSQPTKRPGRDSRDTTAAPEFTLAGVSRIGDSYSAILRHKDGKSFIIKADPTANTGIPEHSGYSLVAVSADSVSIHYPDNNACIEFSDLGVRCGSASNIAELVLANREPLVARNPATQDLAPVEPPAGANDEITEEQVERSNPFEVLRNARQGDGGNAATNTNAATTAGSTAGARFTPRRIPPEDVPEGKRVVATPFGDRLVDQ